MTRRVAVPVLFLWGLALGLALAGSARAQDATPIPTPTPVSAREIAPAVPLASPAPTPTHPLDGAIERLTLIHVTPRSAYYALTYWSDGLRVTGFLGRMADGVRLLHQSLELARRTGKTSPEGRTK